MTQIYSRISYIPFLVSKLCRTDRKMAEERIDMDLGEICGHPPTITHGFCTRPHKSSGRLEAKVAGINEVGSLRFRGIHHPPTGRFFYIPPFGRDAAVDDPDTDAIATPSSCAIACVCE